MELKVTSSVLLPVRLVFQSHLYGIESILYHARGSPQSFNRTFMELKDGGEPDAPLPYDVSIAPLWNWKSVEPWEGLERGAFQSHLYGIERLLRFSSSAGMTVSIAPLWNWKTVNRMRIPKCLSFNRTFMELKVRNGVKPRYCLAVSIAPLWNWKPIRGASVGAFESFNRTFMELKVCNLSR